MFGKGGQRSPLNKGEGEGEGEGESEGEAWERRKPPSPVHRAWPMVGLAVLVLVWLFMFGGSVRGPLYGIEAPDRTSPPCTLVRFGLGWG